MAGCCEHGNKTSGYINMRNSVNSWETTSLSRITLLHVAGYLVAAAVNHYTEEYCHVGYDAM